MNTQSNLPTGLDSTGRLPKRSGPRPLTSKTAPHMQLNQQPAKPLSAKLIEFASRLPGVLLAPSRRAPANTIGLYLSPEQANGPADAFMLATEFAHVHPSPDFSLHLTLPESLRRQAIDAGWVEAHPLAGYPTVSNLIVLLFAPRDDEELAVAIRLLEAAWAYAQDGRNPEHPN